MSTKKLTQSNNSLLFLNNLVIKKNRLFRFFSNSKKSLDNLSHKKRSVLGTIFGLIFKCFILVFFSLIILLPFYFMINTALLTNEQSIDGSFYWISPQANWDSFKTAFNAGYWQALGLTFLVTVVSVTARVFFSMTAGYAFSLHNWRFKRTVWALMLVTLMLPEVALMLGQYRIVVQLNWNRDGFLIIAMFLPFMASAFSAFMYKNAFLAISDHTKEAAMIDGVGTVKFFFKVAIPMVKTTTLTVVILTAFASWNSFTWPQLLVNGSASKYYVLSNWIYLTGQDTNASPDDQIIIYNNIRMAGAILAILPMLIAYFLFRKVMMKAISRQGSATKG